MLVGPLYAGAALLVLAGATKVLDPAPLRRALRSVGLTLPAAAVRAGAAAEVALGVAAVLTGSRWAALGVAVSYAAFTAFVLLALRRGGVLASCGCFGKADTPPTRVHAAVTAALALAAAGVAARPAGSLPNVLAASPGAGVPLLAGVLALAVTAYLALAVLPLVDRRATVKSQPAAPRLMRAQSGAPTTTQPGRPAVAR